MAAQRVAVRWPTMNGNWASSLTLFAKNPKPATLPSGVYLRHDEHTVTIYDGYPKAKYHFLVLPRIPFKLETTPDANSSIAPPKLGLAGGKLSLGVSSSSPSRVPDTHLRSLNDVLASPYAGQILEKLHLASRQVVQLVKEEMKATTKGVEWAVRVGFHAVPSMETVHVHVISDDLVSDRLKNKKHYQSFHPTHGFWLDLADVRDLVGKGKRSVSSGEVALRRGKLITVEQLPHSAKYYEDLLRSPLISFRNQKEYSNISKLKEHLEQAWKEEVDKKSQALAADSKKRKPEDSEEEDSDGKSRRMKSTTPTSSATESES